VKQTSALVLLVVALASAAGCLSDTRGVLPTGTLEPDKFLFDKGNEALTAKGLAGTPGPEDGSAVRFFATDSPERFARVGAIFLNRAIDPATVELVDLRAL
jgi:hypothetical protein